MPIIPFAPSSSISRKIVNNTVYQLLNGSLGGFFSVVHTALVSRYLGVSSFGAFSLVLAHVLFFYGFTSWGTDTIAVRQMAQEPELENEWLGSLLSLRIVLSAAALVIAWATLPYSHYPSVVVKGVWIYSSIMIFAPFESFLAVYQARLTTGFTVFITLLSQVLTLVGTLVAIHCRSSLAVFLALAAGGTIFRLVALLFHLRPVLHWHHAISFQRYRFLLFEGIPLALGAICSAMTGRFAMYILAQFHDLQAVGLFAAPFRLISFLFFIPQALMVPVYPLFCQYWPSQMGPLNDLFRKTNEALGFFCVPLAVGGFVLAPAIMTAIFGAKFMMTTPIFRILLLQLIMVYIALPAGILMVAAGRQRASLFINVFGATVGILLMIAAVPRYAAVGVSWGLVAMQFVTDATTFIYVHRMGVRFRAIAVWTFSLCGGMMAAIVYFTASHYPYSGLFAGLMAYGVAVAWFLGWFKKQPYRILFSQ